MVSIKYHTGYDSLDKIIKEIKEFYSKGLKVPYLGQFKLNIIKLEFVRDD